MDLDSEKGKGRMRVVSLSQFSADDVKGGWTSVTEMPTRREDLNPLVDRRDREVAWSGLKQTICDHMIAIRDALATPAVAVILIKDMKAPTVIASELHLDIQEFPVFPAISISWRQLYACVLSKTYDASMLEQEINRSIEAILAA